MGENSKIEWTDASWNPVVGCSLVSPGCTNCYAMREAARQQLCAAGSGRQTHYAGTTMDTQAGPVWTGKVALAPDHILTAPLRWRRPRRIFVNSMGDLFHVGVPDEWIDRVFAVMALCPQHIFQVLTKRSTRMRAYMTRQDEHGRWPALDYAALMAATSRYSTPEIDLRSGWPLPNVWLGVSAEDQRRADERVPALLATPAAVRFVSAEPLLGPIDFTRVGTIASIRRSFPEIVQRQERGRPPCGDGSVSGFQLEALGHEQSSTEFFQTPDHMGGFTCASPRRFPRIDLVIVGGESGLGARSMHPDWVRSIRDQCAAVGVPFFFKQWGEWAPSTPERAVNNPRSGWQCLAGHPHVAKREELYPEAGAAFIERVGKRAAGRLLDGRTHDNLPEVHHG